MIARAAILSGILLAFVALPWTLSPTLQHVLVEVLIAAVFATGFNLANGSGGMLSFGHAAYLGWGAFATMHAMRAVEAGLDIPTPLLPLAGGLAGFVVGLIVAAFATLRAGVYFAMITLAFAELFYQLAPNLPGLFGGETGLSSFRMPFGPISFTTDLEVYYLTLAWAGLVLGLLWLYRATPFGRLTIAVGDNEQRVRFLGYDVYRTKVLIFGLSAAVCGVAGGLLSVAKESAGYDLFSLQQSANAILFTYIGGVGVYLGPSLGAGVLTLGGYLVSNTTRLWPLYQGILFVLIMMYAPDGLGGLFHRHAGLIRGMRAAEVARSYVPRGAALLLLTIATVFLCEAGSVLVSRDYGAATRAAGGRLVPARFLGAVWDPLAPMTWIIPCISLVLGIALLRKRASASGPT